MDLSDRLRTRMQELELKGIDITKATGMSSGGVSHWLNGTVKPSGKYLLPLCRVLQCQPDYLIYGAPLPGKVAESSAVCNVRQGPDITGVVPLISWVQAGEWTAMVSDFEQGEITEWQATTAKVGPNAFALRVLGDSMVNPIGFPSIPEGSIIIVDPESYAENGKIVVATLEEAAEATLKKLIIDGPHRYLKPLNPDYKPMQINKNCVIVGVVRQVISDL